MKLFKICLCILSVISIFTVSAMAEPSTNTHSWVSFESKDDFGNPIENEGGVMNAVMIPGTYSKSASVPVFARIWYMEEIPYMYIEFYNGDMTNVLEYNYGPYDKTYTIAIQDEAGVIHEFFGVITVGSWGMFMLDEKAAYDRVNSLDELVFSDMDDILMLLMSGQELDVSIRVNEGTSVPYLLTIDTSGFGSAYSNLVDPLTEYNDKAIVKKAQTMLNEAGYECGTPDGIAGKNTAAAISQYQTDNGLTVTGTITHEFLIKIGIVKD